MNREEAKTWAKYGKPSSVRINMMLCHILDSIDAIEKRLENSYVSGTIELTSSNEDLCTKDCDNCGDCSREYRTMAEHIEQRPEGMTAGEARQDFIERCLANGAEVACTTIGRFAPIAGNKIMQFIGECRDDSIRLPLDSEGKLPDYPLLKFPSISRKPFILRSLGNKESWVKVAGDKGLTIVSDKYKTTDAAKAMWNKWLRERFGVKYGEGE